MTKQMPERYQAYLDEMKKGDIGEMKLEFLKDDSFLIPAIQEFSAMSEKMRRTSYPDEAEAFESFSSKLTAIKNTITQFSCGDNDMYQATMEKFITTASFQIEKL